MQNQLTLNKFTLIITTRCNLRCKLCCEYVPQNKPFPDMTLNEERTILNLLFETVDGVQTLHLSGGGEPFLHPLLFEMIDIAFEYSSKFERFMLFTNCTIIPSQELLNVISKYAYKTTIQTSRYGINPKREQEVISLLETTGANLKIEKYYGEDQSFGGWVDFGDWEHHNYCPDDLSQVFNNCAVTRDMHGNWRTRDGKVHWCSRSQRGTELGLLPDNPNNYVDLINSNENREQKREKFRKISEGTYLSACNYCSGEQGTNIKSKRYQAAEQL